MRDVKYGIKIWKIWSVICGDWNVKCEMRVWSLSVYSVEYGKCVECVECKVWSVECTVWIF